ncbi:mitochondrial dynamics protein MID49 [Latimeria chalumnae]|uniref:Mitochondrial elongation factor 2 n=1 Tax=Latimeria chalumnae TaxID=7897 RepID=H3AJE6_LATCH|nr:PREDICTED: mitochondrial dynamics protein MID49 [Latimeria chalumnae]XP_005997517.1 PREDICTED: mitochondrial dynamics protein MID49 [Latimeria chalumnae]XP_014344772.1 PREDICTED: mitochondrial dynamics protein MID49 [Latimeria chalumnae]|eukprot:XP_005997516.1 PREDICTED: mitochondrial dynamics protein MID49 [Latimeria chalumnae]
MADLVQNRGKRRNDDGLGSVVDFLLANARLVLGIGGAALLGIATLAVKRLIDRASSPPDDEKPDQKLIGESWKELSLIGPSPKPPRKGTKADLSEALPVPGTNNCGGELEKQIIKNTAKVEIQKENLFITLQEKLLHYYKSHVAIKESDVGPAKELAFQICMELQNFLQNKYSEMPLGKMNLAGSLYDGMQVIKADHVSLLIPLVLEENLWWFIPGEDTILNAPEFWMIRRMDLEYFPRGSSYWDRYTVGGYLSSKAIIEAFHKIVLGTINWPAIGSMLGSVIRPVVVPGELKLEINHEQGQLNIDILPTTKIADTVLFAEPCTKGYVDNLWCQSFYTTEMNKLRDLDDADFGFRQYCIRILKGICKDNPPLVKLSTRQLTTVVLHLSETQPNWAEETLADRFEQVLENLIGYLEKGVLPCYFNNKINLFSELSEEDIDEIGYTLYSALFNPDQLLQK